MNARALWPLWILSLGCPYCVAFGWSWVGFAISTALAFWYAIVAGTTTMHLRSAQAEAHYWYSAWRAAEELLQRAEKRDGPYR